MSHHNLKTTRWLKPKDCLDGTQEWTSTTHAANIGGEIHVKPHLPGIIIFVHGVNSEGEWYDNAERDICDGLNERLNLSNTPYKLRRNVYYQPTFILDKNNYDNSHYIYEQPIRTLTKIGNSPVIRFYWGYRATEDDLGEYVIPLKNKQGESYHRLVEEMINPEYSSPNKNSWNAEDKHKYSIVQQYESLSYKKRRLFIYEKLKDKGPFFWGGGPFQNGCNNLISLWSNSGFNNWPMLWGSVPIPSPFPFPINVQALNPESDRLLTKAPPRKYYAHAVNRLAKLIKKIRDYNKYDTVTVISHSQGTMIALAAAALEAPDALFVLNSPYSIEDKALNSFNYPYDENISKEVREATLSEIINKIAENKNKLKEHPSGVVGLVVGCSEDKKSWTPDIRLLKGRKRGNWLNNNIVTPTEENSIKERDNHGNTYIYCNPHDRVMGSSPLQSIGWSGIPNITKNNQTTPHPLFEKNNVPYVRMLARNTPCGDKPNPKTVFSDKNSYYSDGRIFWDSNTTTLHGIAWPPPPANMFININAPEVPYPIKKEELVNFDEDFTTKEVKTDDKNKQTEKTKDVIQ